MQKNRIVVCKAMQKDCIVPCSSLQRVIENTIPQYNVKGSERRCYNGLIILALSAHALFRKTAMYVLLQDATHTEIEFGLDSRDVATVFLAIFWKNR